MNYENELLGLMPMLRAYLTKIQTKFEGLVDADDLFQECMVSAVKSSEKPKIRSPRNYFIGVFNKTIKRVSVRNLKEFQARHAIVVDGTWDRNEDSIIEEIDARVRCQKAATRRVWAALKEFHGNQHAVCRALGSARTTVQYHKEKLRTIYETVRMN